jgi:LPXTG-site transpeptidase (sortase) family protein
MKKIAIHKMSKDKAVLALGVLLIATGLMFGGIQQINSWLNMRGTKVQAQGLKSSKPVVNSAPLVTGTPVHISIPNVNIDIPVIPGYYYPANNSWTLSLDNAQWGTMTSRPNNKGGETYIYAHYRVHVFYNLPKIKPGDEAIITTDNGHTFIYKYVSNTVVTPQDTSLFKYTGKPILVLQTCTGAWYQYRQLFVLDLVQVDQTPVKN